MKQGQGLQLNTIIIAALGLIVLIILIVLVQQRTTLFSKGVKQAGEGTCAPDNEKKPVGSDCDVIYAHFTDLNPGEICCKQGTVR